MIDYRPKMRHELEHCVIHNNAAHATQPRTQKDVVMTTHQDVSTVAPFNRDTAAAAAPPKRLPFAASRATRQTEKSLERSDAYIYETPAQSYASVEKATTSALSIPQYRRTYIQGCACATGISGGGCCPGSAMGTAAQAGAGSAPAMAAMIPADVAIGALSLYGMYSGYSVTRNAYNAMQQLRRVETFNAPELARAQLWSAQVNHHDGLVHTRQAAKASVKTLKWEQRNLRESIAEQNFNMAVPGLTQLMAAATATVGTIGHLAGGCLGAIGGMTVGSCASGLFAFHGGALALKNLREYVQARKLKGVGPQEQISGDKGVDERYSKAVNLHLQSLRNNKLVTGLAWTAVCAAGVLGTLVASGALAFAGALPVVLGVGLAAGAWAMWQNSRTRYAPHIPLSPHVERAYLHTAKDRAVTWTHLSRQDAAIKQAVAQMVAVQKGGDVAKFHFQRLFRPQCGPKAFTVLAKSVQGQRGHVTAVPTDQLPHYYENVQLKALQTWCTSERELLSARFQGRSEELWRRCYELKALTSPCCTPMAKTAEAALELNSPAEQVYTRAARGLEADAFDLEQAARRLLALDTLSATLTKLEGGVGALRSSSASTWSESQRDWVFARIHLLQLSGTLSDAVSVNFMKAHPEFFSQLSTPDALPIGNVFLLPEQVLPFARAIADELDGQFVHAFFNPRRIEAEMDFILEREIQDRSETTPDESKTATAAPQCSSKTCCQ